MKAIGMVSPSAWGKSVTSRNPTVGRSTLGQKGLRLDEHRVDG